MVHLFKKNTEINKINEFFSNLKKLLEKNISTEKYSDFFEKQKYFL